MANLIRTYRRLLHERPFVANVLTTCCFMAAGDAASQWMLQKDQYDPRQTARFAAAGLIFVGPVVRGCLVMIDRLFGPTASLKVLAKKLLLDQGLLSPCFLAGNITTLTLLETRSLEKVGQQLRSSYFSLLLLNYSFWPFVQVLNFYFVPLTYRVLFGSSAALGYNTIFSYRLWRGKQERRHEDQASE